MPYSCAGNAPGAPAEKLDFEETFIQNQTLDLLRGISQYFANKYIAS